MESMQPSEISSVKIRSISKSWNITYDEVEDEIYTAIGQVAQEIYSELAVYIPYGLMCSAIASLVECLLLQNLDLSSITRIFGEMPKLHNAWEFCEKVLHKIFTNGKRPDLCEEIRATSPTPNEIVVLGHLMCSKSFAKVRRILLRSSARNEDGVVLFRTLSSSLPVRLERVSVFISYERSLQVVHPTIALDSVPPPPDGASRSVELDDSNLSIVPCEVLRTTWMTSLIKWLRHVRPEIRSLVQFERAQTAALSPAVLSREAMQVLPHSIVKFPEAKLHIETEGFREAKEVWEAALQKTRVEQPWNLMMDFEIGDDPGGVIAALLKDSHLLSLEAVYLGISAERIQEGIQKDIKTLRFRVSALPFAKLKKWTVFCTSDESVHTICESLESGNFVNLSELYVIGIVTGSGVEAVARLHESGKTSQLRELYGGMQHRSLSEQTFIRFAHALESGNLPALETVLLPLRRWGKLWPKVRRAFINAYQKNTSLRARLCALDELEPSELRTVRNFNGSLHSLEHEPSEQAFIQFAQTLETVTLPFSETVRILLPLPCWDNLMPNVRRAFVHAYKTNKALKARLCTHDGKEIQSQELLALGEFYQSLQALEHEPSERTFFRLAHNLKTVNLPWLETILLPCQRWDSLALDVRRAFINAYTENTSLKARLRTLDDEEPSELHSLQEYHESLQALKHEPSEQAFIQFAHTLEMIGLPWLEKVLLPLSSWESLSLDVRRAFVNAYKRNTFLKTRLCTIGEEEPLELRPLREYNKSLQALEHEPEVTGTFGKVFICGDARIGKTTLRKTLLQQHPRRHRHRRCMISRLKAKEAREVEPPTRGIEVHHLQFSPQSLGGQRLELAVWDLAGQSEYEVLHSAFLPDLALADGQATFFVVVCSANRSRCVAGKDAGHGDLTWNSESNEDTARASLVYWLRFIASNSSDVVRKNLRRKVLLVLNCFDNHRDGHDLRRWVDFLSNCQVDFQDLLVLQKVPFIINACNTREVNSLKMHLAEAAGRILQQRKVPQVCANILDSCRQWVSDENNHKYPVVSWAKFSKEVVEHSGWCLEVMKAATIYLHEAGHLVLFRELKKSGCSSSAKDAFEREAVVVLHPHWFCHKVMGHLLLPDSLVEDGKEGLPSRYLNLDGSLPLALVNKELFQISPEHLEETFQILVRLHLCYEHPTNGQKVFVPALIQDDSLPKSFTEAHQNSNRDREIAWVMGFSLAPTDPLRNLLPVDVLRKLQVDLAYDVDIGRRPDRSFKAGISRISFNWKSMAFLVEFQRDPTHATYNRLDILVQPLSSLSVMDGRSQRQQQVRWAHHLVERTQEAASRCCPNVKLTRLIIKPWERSAGYRKLEDRDVSYSVDEMVLHLKGSVNKFFHGEQPEWHTNWLIGEEWAKYEDLLPEKDCARVASLFGQVEERCKREEAALDKLGVLKSAVEVQEVKVYHENNEPGSGDEIKSWFRMQFQILHDQIDFGFNQLHKRHDRHDKNIQGLEDMLGNVIRLQVSLYKRVQSLETFTVEAQRSSVPRFPYLTTDRRSSSSWVNIGKAIKDMFSKEFFLRFLCEFGHADSKIHEVQGQRGISMRDRKEWVYRIVPALNWSLKIAFWAMKISGQVILPGLGLLVAGIPDDIISNEATMTTGILDALKLCSETVGQRGGTSDVSPAKETEIRQEARGALKKLLGELSPVEFESLVGLKKVCIEDRADHTKHVVWICHSCFKKYGPRAKLL